MGYNKKGLVRQTRFELAGGVLLITGTPLAPKASAFTSFATAAQLLTKQPVLGIPSKDS